jgi:hypothetical protein
MTSLEELQALTDDQLIENACCQHCGKRFHLPPSTLAVGRGKYCSRACFYDATRKHPVIEFDGIRYNFKPRTGYYENANSRKKLHKEVWKKHHGPIPSGFDVHHKDEDKMNNDPSNLELKEHGEHSSHHNATRTFSDRPRCEYCSRFVLQDGDACTTCTEEVSYHLGL